MRPLQKISFLLEDFAVPSPGQQLLDRCLIGYHSNGQFAQPHLKVRAWVATGASSPLIKQRQDAFGLKTEDNMAAAARETDALVIAGPGDALGPKEQLIRAAIQAAPAQTPVFVYGLLASNADLAWELRQLARARDIILVSGTALPLTFRLPQVEVPLGAAIREALIVVQGDFPAAEFDALQGLMPLVEKRKHGKAGIRRVRYLADEKLWKAGDDGAWSWKLLAAALSRSHTPQGHPVLDGRTEDLVGLGLVPKLAKGPRAWLIEHNDGMRLALLVLNGVVADYNYAVRLANEQVISAQLFRAPRPAEEHFSLLVGRVLEFFTTGVEPWPFERTTTEAALMATIRAHRRP